MLRFFTGCMCVVASGAWLSQTAVIIFGGEPSPVLVGFGLLFAALVALVRGLDIFFGIQSGADHDQPF